MTLTCADEVFGIAQGRNAMSTNMPEFGMYTQLNDSHQRRHAL
jgi:hypothetical protein